MRTLRFALRSRWHALLALVIVLDRLSTYLQLVIVRAALKNPETATSTRDQLARASEYHALPETWQHALETTKEKT